MGCRLFRAKLSGRKKFGKERAKEMKVAWWVVLLFMVLRLAAFGWEQSFEFGDYWSAGEYAMRSLLQSRSFSTRYIDYV